MTAVSKGCAWSAWAFCRVFVKAARASERACQISRIPATGRRRLLSGWGTWIRTKTNRVRVCCATVTPFPNYQALSVVYAGNRLPRMRRTPTREGGCGPSTRSLPLLASRVLGASCRAALAGRFRLCVLRHDAGIKLTDGRDFWPGVQRRYSELDRGRTFFTEILADDHEREFIGPREIRLGKIAKSGADHNELTALRLFHDPDRIDLHRRKAQTLDAIGARRDRHRVLDGIAGELEWPVILQAVRSRAGRRGQRRAQNQGGRRKDMSS